MLDFHVERLENGVRLVTVPMRDRASVSVAFMFAVGSRYETRSDCGLAHFIEHAVFKGCAGFPTAQEISEAIESVGGVLNAATDKESTVFYTKVPRQHAGLATRVLGSMLFSPILEAAELEKEKQVVIEELRMYRDNPQEYVGIVFDEVMYPNQPLGWDVAGTEKTVRAISAQRCREYLASRYLGEAAVVAVAGAIEPDEARQLVGEALPKSFARQPEQASAPALEVHESEFRVINKKTEQANLLLGGYSCSYLDPRRYAVDLLNVVLGEGMSSRLFIELREERALVYDVHSYVNKLRDSGTLAVSLGCDGSRAPEAVKHVVGAMERLASQPVTPEELRKAKEYTKGRLLLGLESTSAVAQYAGQQELMMGKIETPEEIAGAYDAVTAEEVQHAAAEILQGSLRGAAVGTFSRELRAESWLAMAS